MTENNEIFVELQDTEWPFTYIDHDRIVARAIVVDDEGCCYFVRAVRDDNFGKSTLIETSGGGVEAGEELDAAIKRELKEELGAEVDIICRIGVVSDYYNLVHRHNITHYYLCKVKSFGEKNLTYDEINNFHLTTLRMHIDDAISEYGRCSDSRLGRLIARRELPAVRRAKEILEDSAVGQTIMPQSAPSTAILEKDAMENTTVRPFFSIIIPIFNSEKYLADCFNSVLAQTFCDYEVILVDDGSSDGSYPICCAYAKKEARFKVIHKENGGVSSARNAGLEKASGRYVMFIDSDDYIDPDMLGAFYDAASGSGYDIICCGYRQQKESGVWEERRICGTSFSIDRKEYMLPLAFAGIYPSAYSVSVSVFCRAYRRGLLDGILFDTSIRKAEDMLFNLQAAATADSIFMLAGLYYYYRYTPGSAMNTYRPQVEKGMERSIYILSRVCDLLDAASIQKSMYKPYLAARVISIVPNMCEDIVRHNRGYIRCRRMIKDIDEWWLRHVSAYGLNMGRPSSKKFRLLRFLIKHRLFLPQYVIAKLMAARHG